MRIATTKNLFHKDNFSFSSVKILFYQFSYPVSNIQYYVAWVCVPAHCKCMCITLVLMALQCINIAVLLPAKYGCKSALGFNPRWIFSKISIILELLRKEIHIPTHSQLCIYVSAVNTRVLNYSVLSVIFPLRKALNIILAI